MKIEKIFILFFVLITIGTSCNKYKGASFNYSGLYTRATWFNESGVGIEYIPFYQGSPVFKYIFTIDDKDSFLIGRDREKISGKGPTFYSKYIAYMDSVYIVYDNLLTV